MRETTALVALAIAFSGSSDSAAAIVTISAPTNEKITTTIPLKDRHARRRGRSRRARSGWKPGRVAAASPST